MTLSGFLETLMGSGEIHFSTLEPPRMDVAEEAAAIQELEKLDDRLRADAPHEPPPFRTEPALWAAGMLYRIAQFLVFREVPASRIEVDLSETCPGEPGPVQTWSVDLTFHRLPELLQRAAHVASADPLVEQLQRLAWEWPLSSTGIPLALDADDPNSGPDLSAILSHLSLRQIYLDRIVRTGDASRLHHPEVRRLLENSAGAYPELAGDLLNRQTTQDGVQA